MRSLNKNNFENLEVKAAQLGFELSNEYQREDLQVKKYEYTKKYWYISLLSLDFVEKNGEREVSLYAFPKEYEIVYYLFPFIAWIFLVIKRMRAYKNRNVQ